VKRVLVEGIVVALAGAVLAFLANAVSPRHLSLTTDYFKRSTNVVVPVPATTNAHPSNSPSPAELLAARLQKEGLQVANSNKVAQLFQDPRCRQNLVIFVDVRNDAEYAKGHIPGAYQFDRYRPDNYLPTVLGACTVAEEVVVYCNGGECEDSELAAVTLRDIGIPKEKLYVYPGGWTEWSANRMVIEVGPQNSGQLLNNK
jgi:rhodanese-related sulfurtransferase